MPSTTTAIKVRPSEYTSSSGNKQIMYYQNRDEDVEVTSNNSSLPAGSNTVKDVIDDLTATAFTNPNNLVNTSGAQDVSGVKTFTNGIKIGNFSITESVDQTTGDPIFDISYITPPISE